jgi:hypothetical protein
MQPAAQRQILHQVRSAALRGQSIAWMPGTLAVRPPGLGRPFVRWLPRTWPGPGAERRPAPC